MKNAPQKCLRSALKVGTCVVTNMDSLYTTTYIGNKPGAQDVYTHAQVLENQNVVIESAVLAGPVTIVNAFTVTGTLVII